MPKVSVLIPAYNVQPYIRECLDSVLAQTMSDVEIICVDDGSVDNTPWILREYQASDSRIQVYCHDRNRGQSCGRNLALGYASGEYVYMLDADDRILPETLEELYRICTLQELDVVGFETRQFAEHAAFWEAAAAKTIVYQEGPVMDGREAFRYCMETESLSLSVPTFMMKRSYLEDIHLRFVEGILHEDVGYIFELITRARRIRFLHKVYFLRRIRPQSTMTRGFTARNIEGYLKSFLRSFELEKELPDFYGGDPAFRRAVKKWQRDIYGRLTQLYLSSENTIYHQEGGCVDQETYRMLEILKIVTYGEAHTEDILGKERCSFLKSLPSKAREAVYICGMGQYAQRAIDMAGSLGLIVKGILVDKKHQKAFRGFPVYETWEAPDKSVPVIMGVSHYHKCEYERLLHTAGYDEIIYIRF